MGKGISRMTDEDALYVASMTYDLEKMVTPYANRYFPGQIDHYVVVTSKKKLVYSVTDNRGNKKYYDYKTDKEIREYKKKASYSTAATPSSTLYHSAISDKCPKGLRGISAELKEYAKRTNVLHYGYLVPFESYMELIIGTPVSDDSAVAANAIMKMSPKNRAFVLSFNEKEATEQLKENIYGPRPLIKCKKK